MISTADRYATLSIWQKILPDHQKLPDFDGFMEGMVTEDTTLINQHIIHALGGSLNIKLTNHEQEPARVLTRCRGFDGLSNSWVFSNAASGEMTGISSEQLTTAL